MTSTTPKNIDCLACHDQTGTYKKVAAPGGAPEPAVDLQSVAQSVGMNGGVPPRATCVFCHSRARGGDMKCVAFHQVKKDASGSLIDHGIGGFMFHSTDEGVMKDCEDCHGSAASIHVGTPVEIITTSHDRLACQVSHIPTIVRKVATYVDWRWEQAGLDVRPDTCAASPTGIAADSVTQRGTYNKMKGCLTWATNARPVLRYYNGKSNRVIMGQNDSGLDTGQPVDLGSLSATYHDADAKIYPFKIMTGNQPFDAVDSTVLVPHLWGTVTGSNPYWGEYDWDAALRDSSAYSATLTKYGALQQHNGSDEFADAVMLLKIDHEVAPKETAYGRDKGCTDCHFSGQIDWAALVWTGDPTQGGTQARP